MLRYLMRTTRVQGHEHEQKLEHLAGRADILLELLDDLAGKCIGRIDLRLVVLTSAEGFRLNSDRLSGRYLIGCVTGGILVIALI